MGGLKVKRDCFAFDSDRRTCKALNDLYCLRGKCSFYKTAKERCAKCKESRKEITCEICIKQGLK